MTIKRTHATLFLLLPEITAHPGKGGEACELVIGIILRIGVLLVSGGLVRADLPPVKHMNPQAPPKSPRVREITDRLAISLFEFAVSSMRSAARQSAL